MLWGQLCTGCGWEPDHSRSPLWKAELWTGRGGSGKTRFFCCGVEVKDTPAAEKVAHPETELCARCAAGRSRSVTSRTVLRGQLTGFGVRPSLGTASVQQRSFCGSTEKHRRGLLEKFVFRRGGAPLGAKAGEIPGEVSGERGGATGGGQQKALPR